MKRKKILILCVVVLICVVGLFFVVGGRNIENTMAKNSDNLSSVETVNVVENLEVSDSVESSTEVPSVENSTNVLEETGSKVNYDRGESKGEIIINKVETEKTEVTESNGQLTNTEIPEQHEEGSYYVELAEDGSRKYSPQLITDCMGSEAFEGLTEEEIITVLNNCIPDNIIGDTYEDEAIRDKVGCLDKEWVYQLAGKELPTTETTTNNPSTTTSTTENTTTPSTTTNNNSSTESTAGGGAVSVTPEVQQSTPSTENTVGDTGLTQEQMNEIYKQNTAPGGKGSTWGQSVTWGDSGESWNGRGYN